MELQWLGNINSGYSFVPEKASYRLMPNGHGWRMCIVKPSSSGTYYYKLTNAKTGEVFKDDSFGGGWSYFSVPSEHAKDGVIFESKSTLASQVVVADNGGGDPPKV